MDKQKYFHSSLKDKEPNQNFSEGINKIKKRNSFNPTRLLNIQKLNVRRKSVASIKAHHASAIELKPSKCEMNDFPKLLHKKVKQYELHPFRRPNLKLVGEDIKYRIFEMNEEDHKEQIKESKIKTIKTGFSDFFNDIETTDKNPNINQIIKDKKSEVKTSQIKEKNKSDINDVIGTRVSVKIINGKKPKKKKRIEKVQTLKLINKYRNLNRIKNLYDSNDDDESDEEKEDEYIINPETKIIRIFDFLMIVLFLYHFNYSTISLCKERCFCPMNKRITFSDVLLFIYDIFCILDLIISFFRAYYNFEYKLIKSNHLILINFLKYDFTFDLLSAIPIFTISKYICLEGNYIQCFKYEMQGNLIFLKLCSVLKALKINKIINHKKNQAMEKFFELISESYSIEKAVTILIHALIYIGVLHCIVCIHIFLGSNSYSNWLILTDAQNEPFQNIYIKSLYFMITTLTTIGYGDIVCQSMIERVFQIIILVIGSIFYPYVISTIGNIIKKDSNAKIKHDNNLSMLEKIRKDYPNISFKLYNSIYKYIEGKSHSLQKYDVNSFIESLPFSLKNNILFTMYQTSITDFKFFKNSNSVFIADVLNNFIPCISKRNEFLIYEGEMVEEIIFVKDGRISLNAAINTEDPTTSINKYFFENFSPFTTEEEKKLINENMNNKSKISMISEITYDKAKNKLNNAFKTIGSEKNAEEKNQFQINPNAEKNDIYYFDIKGGAIINDEGNYQYLKILDIRKNEHFGCVFMTMKRPCPLSLQVKSKIAELFLLKKEPALNLSRSYPNIWRKLYGKEFHNLRSIKNLTFTLLKKYIKVNELFINNNIDDILMTNDITVADLNFLEKSALADKSMAHSIKNSPEKQDLHKNSTLNYVYDNKNKKINLETLKLSLKAKIIKNAGVRRNSTFTGYKNQLLPQRSLNVSSSNEKSSIINFFGSKNNDINKEKNKIPEGKRNKEKLKKLKDFLIKAKKYFADINRKKDSNPNSQNINENNNKQKSSLSSKKNNILKNNLKDEDNNINNKSNTIKDNNSNNTSFKKKVEFNLNLTKEKGINKFPNSEKILNDLKDICENETNFSFCSIKKENDYKLSIERNSNFEIISSYPNFNQISKGYYINDVDFQKKIKSMIKHYYLYKHKESDFNESLSLREIVFSSRIENKNNQAIDKGFNSELENNQRNIDSKILKRKIEKYNSFNVPNKFNKMKNRKKISDKILNKTYIKHKNSLFSKNTLNSTIRNNNNNKKNNIDIFSTFNINKNQKILEEEPQNESFGTNSIKVNKSEKSFFSKKSLIKKINSSYSSNNKQNVNLYNNKEIEYIVDKGINKKISDGNIIIDKNSYINTNHQIYNNRKKKYFNNNDPIYNDRNHHLINQMLGISIPNSNIIGNNIITTSSPNINGHKENFNSLEQLKNETSFNIYNIIQKNINKNLNIIDNNQKISPSKWGRTFCSIF